jgi:hypothetical protein
MKITGRTKENILSAVMVATLLFLFGAPAHASVTASPSTVNFGSQALGVTGAPIQVTLTNTNLSNIAVSNASLSGTQFSYSGPSLPLTLNPGQSMTTFVTFTPLATQAYSGTLVFTRANGSTISVGLSGTGSPSSTGYVIYATPTSLSFSKREGGVTSAKNININDLTPGPVPFTLSTDKPWITLSATSSSTQPGGVVLQFGVNPAGLAVGSYSGNVFVTASGVSNSPMAVPMTLTVTPAALVSIAVTPASPSIVKGATQQFTATGTYSDSSTQNLTSTATWSSATVSVATINAAGLATGVAAGTSNITATNSTGNVTSNAATLTVNTPGQLTSNPLSLNFNNVSVGSSSTLSVTLTNSGGSAVTISNVSIAGPGFGASGVPTGTTLNTGQSATLNATFTPAASGSVAGSVTLTSNAANSPTTIALSGTAVQPIQHSVALSWVASTSTVSGYNIYQGTVSGGPYAKLTSALDASTSYTDSTVQSGLSYFYVVTAVDGNNVESVYSSVVSALIPTP